MDEIEHEDVETSPEEAEETIPESESEAEPEEETTEEAPKPEKPKETPEQKQARLTRELERLHKKHPELKGEKPAEPSQAKKGLDDLQLGYLELKGITEQEDIDLVESVMEKTGQSFRDALKDEYVLSKLEANKKARTVANATPSQTKRPGNSPVDDVDYWFAKYSQKWELPANMPPGMAAKVVERRHQAENPSNEPF